ncbi:MAG: hypothetical protein HMLKMBBP_03575 [Planctomycetes bacterium]|nr:hypothetical protein [Planctomycetota bacterium]
MPPHPSSDARPVRGLLAAVARHARRQRFVRGLGWLAAAACAAVVVSFAFDYALDMPVVVRGVHLALVLAALASAAAVLVVAPLRRRESDAEVAAHVEREVPGFEDRLVSALDFEARAADPDEPESREMMSRTIADASRIAATIDPGLLVDRRPARRAVGAALGGLALVAAAQAAAPDAFAVWIRRGLLLEDADWPRRTTIRVLGFPADGPLVVTRGDDLRILAEADGARPADLDMHYVEIREEGAAGEPFRDVRKMFPVPEQPGRYAFDFRAVPSSFSFHVTGGDDTDARPRYEVRALARPGIASFTARVTSPAYTGIPPADVRDPSIDVLAGTKLDLSFTASVPLRGARFVPSDGAPSDAALDADRKTFRMSLEPSKSFEMHVELTGAEGQTNRREDDVYRIQVVPDHAPTVRVLHPYERLVRTSHALIPVKVLVEDDLGVAEVRLEFQHGKAPRVSSAIWTAPVPAAGAPAAAPEKRVHVHRPLDLDARQGEGGAPVAPGDVLTLAVSALDTGKGEARSPDLQVDIVTNEELHNRLTGEMTRLHEDLGVLRRTQRKTVLSIRELRTAAAGVPDAAALRRGRDLQVDQSRVMADLQRFETGILRVFDAYVLNRMGAAPTLEKLIPVYIEALDRAPDETGETFPRQLYDRIVAEKRAKALFDPDVLGTILDVMDLTDHVRAALGPAAADTMDRWIAGTPPAAGDLEAAERAAQAVLSALDAIENRMQSYQDMSAVIAELQRLRDAQDVLARPPTPRESPK